jgi:hypothetical protein
MFSARRWRICGAGVRNCGAIWQIRVPALRPEIVASVARQWSKALQLQERDELVNRQSSIGNNAAQRALPDLLMVRDDYACVGVIAAQNQLAAALPSEYKAGSLQSSANFPAGELSWQRRHGGRRTGSLNRRYLDKFLAGFGRDRVAGRTTVLEVELDRLANIVQGFGSRVALTHTPWQSRHADDKPAIALLFENRRVPHPGPPLRRIIPYRSGSR